MSDTDDRKPFRHRLPAVLLAIVAAFALVGAGCTDDGDSGSEDDGSSGESGGETTSEGRSPGAPEIPAECEEADADTAALEAAEERGQPDTSLAEGVEVGSPVDVVEGEGAEVIAGGSVEGLYSIIDPATGDELQSTWAAGVGAQPIPLVQAPESFTQALEGMKVGGRRVFAVPVSDLGGAPPGSDLAPEDPVVFVLDLVAVSETSGPAAETDEDALAAAESRGAPEMSVPDGTEDTDELVVIDEVEGDGQVVCPDDQVVAHYTGIQASDGEQFDSSWERGEPSPFGLDQVIQGWSEGLVGMKVGGRRTLVIPSDLAYGDDGDPSGTLVFTVDLVGVG